VQILRARCQRVKSVAGFVQHRFHVALQPDGVHENERQPRFTESRLIAAGRLAFAIRQIEQVQVLQRPKTGGEFAVELIENALRFADHFLDLREGPQGRAIRRIDGQVPRAERRQP